MSTTPRIRHGRAVPVVLGLLITLIGSPLFAQRPAAPKLLPKKTLAYVRVADCPELIDSFMATAIGRLGRDEKIKPLVTQLYGSAAQAFTQVQDQIGVSLGEILALPQGEVCVAVVGREEGEPAIVVIIDVGDQLPAAETLLDAAVQAAIRDGKTKKIERAEETELTVLDSGATFCHRDATVLFGSDPDLVKEILKTWSGDEGAATLADNREFTSIMRQSVGTKDERPQITWFVDPIQIFKDVSRQNTGGQMVLAMLPMLGLDGVKSAGGSIIFNTEEFDSISHMHLLLDSPRTGVVEMLAIEPGDTDPEDWVPDDAASYMTVNWDMKKTFATLTKMVDQFQGEGGFSGIVKSRISTPLGVDFEQDVLAQIDNRATHVTWFERPARVNSGTNLVGVKLVDAAAFRQTMNKMVAKAGAAAKKKNYRGTEYFEFDPSRRRRQPDVDLTLIRQPSPCVAVVGDYLLLSDSVKCLEAAISSKLDPTKSLSDGLDFKLINSRIKQHLGSKQPGMISFQRPEETMRSFYDLATSATTRRKLEELAQNNQALRELNQALKDNPLPPFAVIAKYLAPGGGMLVSDETGLHYTTFGLKRE